MLAHTINLVAWLASLA